MKESPLQKGIRLINGLYYTSVKDDYKTSELIDKQRVIQIMEQMELDMMEEFKQGIDNVFKYDKPSYKEDWNPDWKGDPDDPLRWKGW